MTEPNRCPQCNTALIDNAPSGLCPNCLLKLALDSATDTLGLSLNNGKASLSSDSLSLPAGSGTIHFNDYELTQEIARGGMGVVFKARQISLNRIIALKMMRPGLLATEEEIRRFHVEAEAAAKLNHTNIVAIHEVGEQDGLHFFSMDYIEGQSLADLIAEHTLEATRAARYVKTIAEAVHYAHEQGILHRDLKPSNILIDKLDRPHVTDFGLAKRIGGESGMTATGAVLGTPSYMPPEQAEGKIDQMSAASDVYSLGAMMYEMLTGRPPHQAATAVETIMLVLKQEPVSPHLLNPKTDRDLETICLKSLEKSAAKRYQSAKELAEDLGRYLNREPIKARRINSATRAMRWCRRNAWVTAAAAALFLFAVTVTISTISLRRSAISLRQSENSIRERLWLSLIEQARSERLAGDRMKSMEKIAEAARIKTTAELRQEAIQTITVPGAKLLHQFPFGGEKAPFGGEKENFAFSPDSKMLALSGSFVSQVEDFSNVRGLKVWEMYSGKRVAETKCDSSPGALVFSPINPLSAVSRTVYRAKSDAEKSKRGENRILMDPISGLPIVESRSIVLLDPVTGKDTSKFDLPTQWCNRSSTSFFSPDGVYFVNGGYLVNVNNPDAKAVCLKGEPIAFISNDKLLLKTDDEYELYDASTGKYSFYGLKGMEHLSVSANGRIAVLKTSNPKEYIEFYIVWDLLAKKELGRIPSCCDDNYYNIYYNLPAISSDGRLIALHQSKSPNLIEIWDINSDKFEKRFIQLSPTIDIYLQKPFFNQGAFSPDGSLLAVSGFESGKRAVWIWDTQTGNQTAVLRDCNTPVWSNDGRLLATLGEGSIQQSPGAYVSSGDTTYVNVWLVAPPTPTYFLPSKIESLSFSADGKGLASTGAVWEATNTYNRTRLRLSLRSPLDTKVVFDDIGRLWTVNSPINTTTLRQLRPERREIILNSPGYSDIKLKLHNRSFPEKTESKVVSEAKWTDFSPDGKHLVMVCNVMSRTKTGASYNFGDNTLELWDLETQSRTAILNKDGDSLEKRDLRNPRYSPDGRRVAICTGSSIPAVIIRDAISGKKLLELNQQGSAEMAAFSPDSKLLYSAGFSYSTNISGLITVNDVETGKEIRRLGAHKGTVNALAVSPDGRLLASGGDDKTICIWDAATGKELARWEGHRSTVTALAFSPDGETLASGSADSTLKLWNIPFIRRELSSLGLDW